MDVASGVWDAAESRKPKPGPLSAAYEAARVTEARMQQRRLSQTADAPVSCSTRIGWVSNSWAFTIMMALVNV